MLLEDQKVYFITYKIQTLTLYCLYFLGGDGHQDGLYLHIRISSPSTVYCGIDKNKNVIISHFVFAGLRISLKEKKEFLIFHIV